MRLRTYDVTVIIPWRAQPSRLGPYKKVRAFWESTGWPIYESDSNPKNHFNLAQARNNGVRATESEFVIITDADVLPLMDNVIEALDTIEEHVVWPFTRHKYISNDWDGDPFAAPAKPHVEGLLPQPEEGYIEWTGGIYVARRSSFWAAGGFDERFQKWGGEDQCFRIACNTLVGVGRIEGPCISFDHENPGRNGDCQEGGTFGHLLVEYRAADLHPLAMLKLTRNPERFLPQ